MDTIVGLLVVLCCTRKEVRQRETRQFIKSVRLTHLPPGDPVLDL